jgi:hypothetical protein
MILSNDANAGTRELPRVHGWVMGAVGDARRLLRPVEGYGYLLRRSGGAPAIPRMPFRETRREAECKAQARLHHVDVPSAAASRHPRESSDPVPPTAEDARHARAGLARQAACARPRLSHPLSR